MQLICTTGGSVGSPSVCEGRRRKPPAIIMNWFEKERDISISVDDAMEIVKRQYGEGDAYEEAYRDVVFGQIIKKIIEDETFQ